MNSRDSRVHESRVTKINSRVATNFHEFNFWAKMTEKYNKIASNHGFLPHMFGIFQIFIEKTCFLRWKIVTTFFFWPKNFSFDQKFSVGFTKCLKRISRVTKKFSHEFHNSRVAYFQLAATLGIMMAVHFSSDD